MKIHNSIDIESALSKLNRFQYRKNMHAHVFLLPSS